MYGLSTEQRKLGHPQLGAAIGVQLQFLRRREGNDGARRFGADRLIAVLQSPVDLLHRGAEDDGGASLENGTSPTARRSAAERRPQ